MHCVIGGALLCLRIDRLRRPSESEVSHLGNPGLGIGTLKIDGIGGTCDDELSPIRPWSRRFFLELGWAVGSKCLIGLRCMQSRPKNRDPRRSSQVEVSDVKASDRASGCLLWQAPRCAPEKTAETAPCPIYLALLSVMVLWSTKPPLRRVCQLRFLKTTSLIDLRYRDLLRVLPPDPTLGYISDLTPVVKVKNVLDGEFGEYCFQSQYALAPRVLEHSTRPRYVVADLSDPSRLESLCRSHSLRPIAVFPNGVALLEHRPPL